MGTNGYANAGHCYIILGTLLVLFNVVKNWERWGSVSQWRTQEFFSGGGFNKFSWGQRERGSGGGSPL